MTVLKKLALLQTECGAHVLRPAQITPRSREMQLPAYLGRTKGTRYLQYADRHHQRGTRESWKHIMISLKLTSVIRANPVYARSKFHSHVQGWSKTAEKFITDLHSLAQDRDFKDPDE